MLALHKELWHHKVFHKNQTNTSGVVWMQKEFEAIRHLYVIKFITFVLVLPSRNLQERFTLH